MGGIHLIRTEHASRCDHTDRQFALFHGTGLYRGSLGTQTDLIVNEESILFISGRMSLRDIQFCEVVIHVLHFRAFHNLITHTDEDTLHFLQCYGVGMSVADFHFFGRKCNVDHFCFQFFLHKGSFQLSFCIFQILFNLGTGFIYPLTNLWSVLSGYLFHAL